MNHRKEKLALAKETICALNHPVQREIVGGGGGGFIVGEHGEPSAFMYGCDATFYAPCLNPTVGCSAEATRVLKADMEGLINKIDDEIKKTG